MSKLKKKPIYTGQNKAPKQEPTYAVVGDQVYDINSDEYRKLYQSGLMPMQDGLPTMVTGDFNIVGKKPKKFLSKKEKAQRRIQEMMQADINQPGGLGRGAEVMSFPLRGAAAAANILGETMNTPLALAGEYISGRGDYGAALPNIYRSMENAGLTGFGGDPNANQQMTPGNALFPNNPYAAMVLDIPADMLISRGANTVFNPILKQGLKQGTKTIARELTKNRMTDIPGTVNQAGFSDLFGLLKKPKTTPKQVFQSEIDWAKWNPDTPKYPELINEYNTIEESTKKAGTWMKNPDGSPFQGTPEQFIQQQSSWFKKAFGNSKLVNPDGSPTIQYHGSAKKFDEFDESKFQLGDAGYSGAGIYTTPSKNLANSYAASSAKFHTGKIEPTVYELYGQANNPISSSELIKQNANTDLFNFHRKRNWKGELTPEESLMQYDAAIADQLPGVENIRAWHDAREIVFPTNKQLKSAVGNVGFFDMTNPNIYKGLIPGAIATGTIGSELMSQEESAPEQKALGGKINKKNKLPKYQTGGPIDPNLNNRLMQYLFGRNTNKPSILDVRSPNEYGVSLGDRFNIQSGLSFDPMTGMPTGYGKVGINNKGFNLGLEKRKGQSTFNVGYDSPNFNIDATYSNTNKMPSVGGNVGFNTKGFNVGIGGNYSPDNKNISANVGYNNKGFNAGLNYDYSGQSSLSGNVGYGNDLFNVGLSGNYAPGDSNINLNTTYNLGTRKKQKAEPIPLAFNTPEEIQLIKEDAVIDSNEAAGPPKKSYGGKITNMKKKNQLPQMFWGGKLAPQLFDLAANTLINGTTYAVTDMIKAIREPEQEMRPTKMNTGMVMQTGGVVNNDPKKKKKIKFKKKEYDTDSPEYRKLYESGLVSVDADGLPIVYQGSDEAWNEQFEKQRKKKGENAVRKGTGKFVKETAKLLPANPNEPDSWLENAIEITPTPLGRLLSADDMLLAGHDLATENKQGYLRNTLDLASPFLKVGDNPVNPQVFSQVANYYKQLKGRSQPILDALPFVANQIPNIVNYGIPIGGFADDVYQDNIAPMLPSKNKKSAPQNTNFATGEEEFAMGGMIKRADGSYSKRGLWDNIRANKGSGKKPTKQMLEQERKIRAAEKAFGGMITPDMYMQQLMYGSYAQGGQVPQNIPVEVEGGEAYELPNGQMGEFEGPSHANGGIPVALPEQTKVYSKQLKVNGKTMADRKTKREANVAKLEKILSKNPSDKFVREALKRQQETAALEEQQDMAMQEQANQQQQMQEQAQQGMMQEQAMAGLMQDPAMMQQMGMMMYGGKLANGTPPGGLGKLYSGYGSYPSYFYKKQEKDIDGKYLDTPNWSYYNPTGKGTDWVNIDPKHPAYNQLENMATSGNANKYFVADSKRSFFDMMGKKQNKSALTGEPIAMASVAPDVTNQNFLDTGKPMYKFPQVKFRDFEQEENDAKRDAFLKAQEERNNPQLIGSAITTKPNPEPLFDEEQLNMLANPISSYNPLDLRENVGVDVTKKPTPDGAYDAMGNILKQTFENIAISKDPYINTKGGMIPNPLYNEVIGNKMLVEEEPKKPNKFMNWLNKAADETGDFFTGLFDKKGKPKKEKGTKKDEKGLPLTAGDRMGMAGTLFGGLAPMTTTMLNRMMTPKNQNFFREYGAEGLRAMQEAQALSAINRDKQLADIKLGEEASRQRGRNSARGVNTLRAMDIASDITANQAQNQAYNMYAQQMMQLLGQKAQMENQQDQAVMQGEYTRDLADRQDVDNFYTNLAENFASQSELMQKQGRDMNQAQYNKMILEMSPMFSKYGIGVTIGKDGKIEYTWRGEKVDETTARLKMQEELKKEAEQKNAGTTTGTVTPNTPVAPVSPVAPVNSNTISAINPLGLGHTAHFNPIFTDINIPTVTDQSLIKSVTKRRK